MSATEADVYLLIQGLKLLAHPDWLPAGITSHRAGRPNRRMRTSRQRQIPRRATRQQSAAGLHRRSFATLLHRNFFPRKDPGLRLLLKSDADSDRTAESDSSHPVLVSNQWHTKPAPRQSQSVPSARVPYFFFSGAPIQQASLSPVSTRPAIHGVASSTAHGRCCARHTLQGAVPPRRRRPRVDLKQVDAASGAIVGKLDAQRAGSIVATGGLICHVPTGSGSLRVLNPVAGAVSIPAGSTMTVDGRPTLSSYVFGQVPNTVEYKLLRIYTARYHYKPGQSCEILTIDGRGDLRWRPAQSPPAPVDMTVARHRAVAQGFAHFLMASPRSPTSRVGDYDGIASFDLAKEEWRPSLLQSPITANARNCCHSSLSLVELNGCLVFVYHDNLSYCINMWVLADLAKEKWLRIESLQFGSVLRGWEEPDKSQPVPLIPVMRHPRENLAQPLMVLDDGCIAFWVQVPDGVLRVYDPKTRKCKDVVRLGRTCSIVGSFQVGQVGFALASGSRTMKY